MYLNRLAYKVTIVVDTTERITLETSLMAQTHQHGSWFNTYGFPQQQQSRIFAFPYSGAGSLAYHKWAQAYRDSATDFLSVQLPGRENRFNEPPPDDLPKLVSTLAKAISPLLDKPYVFFGHSLGALLAFELCRELRRQGQPLPVHLIVSAFRSPEHPNPNRELHRLSDPDLISAIGAYGGTPPQVLANKELMGLLLPMLRADFKLHETYRYQDDSPLPCPLTALTGTTDPFVTHAHMQNWQQQTTARFQHLPLTGGHFFLNIQHDTINQLLKHTLAGQPYAYSAYPSQHT